MGLIKSNGACRRFLTIDYHINIVVAEAIASPGWSSFELRSRFEVRWVTERLGLYLLPTEMCVYESQAQVSFT
jgi:hypothetical protein